MEEFMLRRIYAWILLVGFLLLLLNIIVFRWEPKYTALVYGGIVVFYIIFPNKFSVKEKNFEQPKDDQNDNDENVNENIQIANENDEKVNENDEKDK